MSFDQKKLVLAALALCLFPPAGRTQLPSVPLAGPVQKLSSVTYFEPPDEQQINLRLSGAEMSPLPGALFDVKQLKVEQFNREGKLQAVVRAPQCLYTLDGVASSAGPLDLSLDEDRVHIQGEGFLWQQKEHSVVTSNQVQTVMAPSLVISNQVRTVIKMGNWKLTTL
jgi:hypothetical protein